MAGRIPQSFLDTLLDRLDIVEVVDRRVKLKKSGKNYTARCPFHDEKTPSFSVNPDKQFYYCFGCGAGGNAIGFVMDYENVDFPQAVDTLAGTLGLEVPREQTDGRPAAAPAQSHKALYELMEQVTRFYQQQLRHHTQAARAIDYLKQRGLSGEIARDYDIGFAPPGWDNLLQHFGKDETSRQRLMDVGMLVQNEESGRIYDRFRDRIMFPIRDQRGRVIAFGGRVLGDEKPKYLNSPETPIFHKGRELYGLYQARQQRGTLQRLLVVEGYMDVIALAQHGITNATATLGTATSEQHLERVFRLCPEVVFCFDGDEAGRKAAFRALEAALPTLQDGRQARFLFLPEGEDPDTAVRSLGADGFEHLLKQAQTLDTFLFSSLEKDLDLGSLDGRARLSKLALPHIRRLPEGVLRQLMFQALAERTGLELTSLMQLEVAAVPAEAPPALTSASAETPTDAYDRPEPRQRPLGAALASGYANLAQRAIALLLHKPQVAAELDSAKVEQLQGEGVELLKELLTLLHLRPESSTAMLLGHWYNTPQGDLLNHLAGQERLIPASGIDQEFLDTMERLSQLPRRSAIAERVDRLRQTNYAEMSAEEKKALIELLQQQRKK